jgi:hypothetical protein
LEEDELVKREIRECNRRWEIPYKIDIILDIQSLLSSYDGNAGFEGERPFLRLRKLQDDEAIELEPEFLKSNADGGIILESWTVSFEDTTSHEIDLTELYKKVIILNRALYTLMRQIPSWKLVKRARMDRAHVMRPFNLIHRISPLDHRLKSAALSLDFTFPGFEAYEPSSKLDLPLLKTSHGSLRISLQYRSQFVIEFGGYDLLEQTDPRMEAEVGPQSFEEIELDVNKATSPRSLSRRSGSLHRMSRPSSISASPKTVKLGLGASLPRRPTSMGNIILPKDSEESLVSSVPRERAKSFQSVVEIPSASSAGNSMRMSSLFDPSVLVDTAITQFIKQCDNHPFLESLPNQNLPKDLYKRFEVLQEQARLDLEPWISDFRAVESLTAAPLTDSRTMTTSAQTGLPLVREEDAQRLHSSADDELIFPLVH